MVILKAHYEARGIRIEPRAPDSADPKELVAYDLRVGKSYQEPGDATIRDFPKPTYVLKPGRCIVVYTLENIAVSHDLLGILCSKASLTAQGLLVANTKIDPGFNDILKISVFNAGSSPITIEQNKPFCSIVFHTLEHRVPTGVSRRPPVIQGEKRSRFSRWWDNVSSSPLFIALAPVIPSFIGSIIIAYLTVYLTLKNQK